MKEEDIKLRVKIQSAFQPSAPITTQSMFAGRLEQMERVIAAAIQKGQHVVLFGERGVGKTSLARIIREVLGTTGVKVMNSGSINCDTTDDFSSLWHKIFAEIVHQSTSMPLGFMPNTQPDSVTLEQRLPENVTPNDVRLGLSSLGMESLVIIDELDRLTNKEAKGLLADTIKTLSDNAVNTTLILVGVAESVNDLIAEHQSIDRALVQVHMPRMSQKELLDIVTTGEKAGALRFTEDARKLIVGLSQGLPHYTHLLCLESSLAALASQCSLVDEPSVQMAIKTIIRNKATVAASYDCAIRSQLKTNLHEKVLLACALSECDGEGYFMSPDVASKLQSVLKLEKTVSAFQSHLSAFCEEKRGPILFRKGERRLFRYRFLDPLMQPYILLQGMSKGLLKPTEVYRQLEFDLGL